MEIFDIEKWIKDNEPDVPLFEMDEIELPFIDEERMCEKYKKGAVENEDL